MTDPFDPTNNPRGVSQFGWVPPANGIDDQPAAVPLLIRLTARLLADRYDRMLAVGVVATPDTALDVHRRRLTTITEREAVARSFRRTLLEARKPLTAWTARSWVHRPNVVAAGDLIDRVTLLLHSPRPINARGMARLRLLLSDGTGPLYVAGRGNLAGELRAALAAL